MTDKIRQVQYWRATADDDLEAIDLLFQGGKFVHALFFTHLALEKILKAHWVNNNPQNVPPKTHNLTILYEKTGLDLTEEDTDFMQMMNVFQIEGRYPDYLNSLHKTTKKQEAQAIISQAKVIFQCLREKLPSS